MSSNQLIQGGVLAVLLFVAFVSAAQNGTAQIGKKVFKLGVNSTNFSAKDLAYLLYTAANDYCKNVSFSTFSTAVTTVKGAAGSVPLLQKYSNFQTCLSNAGSNVTIVLDKVGAAITSNSQTGTICNSYNTKQSKMLANSYTCKQVINTVFIYTNGAVTKAIVQAGVTAIKKHCTTAEWSCCTTAAADFANVTAYNI